MAALREWKKLGATSRAQFKAKLSERLVAPHVPADRLSGGRNRNKIKLRSSGYRLVYSVDDNTITVRVIAFGKRERGTVYRSADARE
ncbi:type II toxin-antitoxin system RelE family toxin [Roseobacter sp. HKCCD5988]|uniref:type II toxin-antitoxin system RelE family toxin n=1 Tax=Roseobacter sp. HKCCD5988 TaxID=3120338 RepID=UPI0030EBA61B